jgi:hypothetical protein
MGRRRRGEKEKRGKGEEGKRRGGDHSPPLLFFFSPLHLSGWVETFDLQTCQRSTNVMCTAIDRPPTRCGHPSEPLRSGMRRA